MLISCFQVIKHTHTHLLSAVDQLVSEPTDGLICHHNGHLEFYKQTSIEHISYQYPFYKFRCISSDNVIKSSEHVANDVVWDLFKITGVFSGCFLGSKTNPENCFSNPLSHETAIANEELPLDLKKTKFPVPMCHIRL